MRFRENVTAIIPAGGIGKRMKLKMPKQFVNVNDKPVIAYTVEALSKCNYINEIIVAVPEGYIPYFNDVVNEFELTKVKKILCGGSTRQETVLKCLIDGVSNKYVLVHDAVRPLINLNTIKCAVEEAFKFGASAVGMVATDTLKITDGEGFIKETIDRNKVWQIQTPQVFETSLLLEAHNNALKNGFSGTDDCSLVENLGHKIKLVPNESINIKITYKDDLKLLGAYFDEF